MLLLLLIACVPLESRLDSSGVRLRRPAVRSTTAFLEISEDKDSGNLLLSSKVHKKGESHRGYRGYMGYRGYRGFRGSRGCRGYREHLTPSLLPMCICPTSYLSPGDILVTIPLSMCLMSHRCGAIRGLVDMSLCLYVTL